MLSDVVATTKPWAFVERRPFKILVIAKLVVVAVVTFAFDAVNEFVVTDAALSTPDISALPATLNFANGEVVPIPKLPAAVNTELSKPEPL